MPAAGERRLEDFDAVRYVDPIWDECLSLSVEHCSHAPRQQEICELAGAVERGASDSGSVRRLVSRRAADEGRWLVDFLAGVRDPHTHQRLVAETIARLRRDAVHRTTVRCPVASR